ncbi:MAG: hypothetical protein KatS3mg002_1047 [Candidatus Woesearchaeota archaeon]|jgi:uncharacterized protein with HEPN domain|nr:MAG: hypothetical protein KatS3mg002_1047 [Candidatus Woesearchaeota archaeon]
MEKKKIELKLVNPITLHVGEISFKIQPYFTFEQEIKIINVYLSTFFDNEDEIYRKYLLAEKAMILAIIDEITDIDIESEDFDLDLFIANGFWNKILEVIGEKYKKLLDDIKNIVQIINFEKKLQLSISSNLNAVFANINKILEKLSQLDEDKLEKLLIEFNSSIRELNEKYPFNDMKKTRNKKMLKDE